MDQQILDDDGTPVPGNFRRERIDFLLDHAEHPRHKGSILQADAVARGGNPGCGDTLTIYLKVDPASRAVAATFEGEGCTLSQAAASYLVELVQGQTPDQILELDQEALIEKLGREIVALRWQCATLSFDTLRAAIRRYQSHTL